MPPLLASGLLLLALLALVALLWLWSLKRGDASVIDVFWGAGFVVAAWIALGWGGGSPRALLLAALVTLWGGRLALHLGARNRREGEDARYAAMREERGAGFRWFSLYGIYLPQALGLWVIALPIQAVLLSGGAAPWNGFDGLALGLWGVGFAFEAVADEQLRRFKADPANRGRVLERGLWRYSRHPNYFGECLIGWAHFGFALAAGWEHAWSVLSPLLLTYLLLRVTGVSPLEAHLRAHKPGYADYAARTSPFVPRPPRTP